MALIIIRIIKHVYNKILSSNLFEEKNYPFKNWKSKNYYDKNWYDLHVQLAHIIIIIVRGKTRIIKFWQVISLKNSFDDLQIL